eukprot:385175_1
MTNDDTVADESDSGMTTATSTPSNGTKRNLKRSWDEAKFIEEYIGVSEEDEYVPDPEQGENVHSTTTEKAVLTTEPKSNVVPEEESTTHSTVWTSHEGTEQSLAVTVAKPVTVAEPLRQHGWLGGYKLSGKFLESVTSVRSLFKLKDKGRYNADQTS